MKGYKLLKIIPFLLFLILFGNGCSNQRKIDINSKKENQVDNYSKVIALTSLTADIVNKLSPESLVAIPSSSLFKNKKEFSNKIVVTQGRKPPNLEKIISLQPDLVLGAKGFHDKALSQIDSLGIDTISTEIKNFSDLELLIERISTYLIVDNPSLYAYAPSCNKSTKDISSDSTIVLVSSSPLLSPNKNSWAGSLLENFNVNNLIGDFQSKSGFQGYVTLSPETLLEKNPDNIILIDTGNDMKELFLSKSYSSNLKAVKNDNVYSFNYYGLINPGSMESINNACDKLKSL